MKKRLLAMLVTLAMSLTMTAFATETVPAATLDTAVTAAATVSFTDTENHWAKEFIDSAVSNGWFQGTSATTFSPDGAVTRGMLVTILGRMAGADENATQTVFADVAQGAYYAPFVAWAYENGVTEGTTATTFSPDTAISRQQLATMLYRFSTVEGAELPAGASIAFSDATSISSYAVQAVDALTASGIISGVGNNRFSPDGVATRAQTAVMLVRYAAAINPDETPAVPAANPSSGSNITSVANVPLLTLNNGVQIPQLGLGTQIQRLEQDSSESGRALLNTTSHDAVVAALQSGYRHLDTAHGYYNERGVGQAIIDSGVPREEIWVTSKLWPSEYGEGVTMAAIDDMLERLQLDYLDVIYLHHPAGDYLGAWKDLEEAYRQGKVRALGISNFDNWPEAFNAIMENSAIKPQLLQIEGHPFAQRLETRALAEQYDIQIECWYPLGHADDRLLSDDVLSAIAQAHNKSVVQTILRWHIQEGFSVIPGSTNPAHIQENIDIFDFELTDAEMAQIRALDQGEDGRYFNLNYEMMGGFFTNPID